MERITFLRLAERLRGPQPASLAFTVPAERYRDPAWCEREKAALFGGPRIVAAASELARGGVRTVDRDGQAALIARDAEGTVRAFHNACRHRGTRLVDAPCDVKALVCPYHGWTYDLAGRLIHVPHEEAFAGLDCSARGLRELEVSERHGLVWLGPGAATFASELDADLAALGLDRHVVWKRATTLRRCNWKLVIEAFLDGYHIRVLHRDSIYRFFLDATSVAESAGPHIRALTGRRALREAAALSHADLRLLATPSYLVFPATVIVVHPDFVSLLTLYPRAADATEWEHVMLVPEARAGDADHWNRSWALIEETVFQREDLWVCEQIQRSLAAGATDELLFGALEEAVPWFHAAIDARLDEGSRASPH